MKLTPPKEITFWISVALAVLALLDFSGTLHLIPVQPFWLLFIAFALLAAGVLVEGL